MKEDLTKTRRDYFWYLKRPDNLLYDVLQMVDTSDYENAWTLYAGLDYWYEKVRRDALVNERDESGAFLSMRSIRCYHATEWVKLKTEYELMDEKHAIPPNPLQHT